MKNKSETLKGAKKLFHCLDIFKLFSRYIILIWRFNILFKNSEIIISVKGELLFEDEKLTVDGIHFSFLEI